MRSMRQVLCDVFIKKASFFKTDPVVLSSHEYFLLALHVRLSKQIEIDFDSGFGCQRMVFPLTEFCRRSDTFPMLSVIMWVAVFIANVAATSAATKKLDAGTPGLLDIRAANFLIILEFVLQYRNFLPQPLIDILIIFHVILHLLFLFPSKIELVLNQLTIIELSLLDQMRKVHKWIVL